jgi:CRP-like cAMP-binding protein
MKQHQVYIKEYLKTFIFSTSEEIEYIIPHLTIREYNRKEFYLNEGDIQKAMGFVCKGLLRRYYINNKGNEVTTGFVKENEYATDYPAFIRQRKSKYYIQCLEPTTIIGLPYDIIQKNYSRHANSQLHGRIIAENVLTILNDRLESFLFNSAEERYVKFIEENPNLSQRVSLTHLATYLGIERQSLSRIRSKMAKH